MRFCSTATILLVFPLFRAKLLLWQVCILGAVLPLKGGSSEAPAPGATANTYNLRVGTQTFAGLYQFTTNSLLVETALGIREMGSDILKFYHGPDYRRQYRIELPQNVTNLVSLARDEPSARAVLDMPFRHYLMWVYPFTRTWAFDGYSTGEAAAEYREVYDLTAHLLTRYSGSGKSFYFGHWEGDWYLLPNYNTATNPSSVAIQGMIDWLNKRQQAIDDAKRDTPHTDVYVYGYAEVNRVVDAMSDNPEVNQRMINCVIPAVTNLDYVSWSAYDIQDAPLSRLHAALEFVASKLPPSKASETKEQRVWIGEYGWGIADAAAQEQRSRDFLRRLLAWNGGPRFMLYWQFYNNEPRQAFSLIDTNEAKLPAYHLHKNFLKKARAKVAEFERKQGRAPSELEFARLVSPLLEKPLAGE